MISPFTWMVCALRILWLVDGYKKRARLPNRQWHSQPKQWAVFRTLVMFCIRTPSLFTVLNPPQPGPTPALQDELSAQAVDLLSQHLPFCSSTGVSPTHSYNVLINSFIYCQRLFLSGRWVHSSAAALRMNSQQSGEDDSEAKCFSRPPCLQLFLLQVIELKTYM